VAAEGGHIEVIKLLLSSGANVYAKDQVSENCKSNYRVFVVSLYDIQRLHNFLLYVEQ